MHMFNTLFFLYFSYTVFVLFALFLQAVKFYVKSIVFISTHIFLGMQVLITAAIRTSSVPTAHLLAFVSDIHLCHLLHLLAHFFLSPLVPLDNILDTIRVLLG